MPRIARLDRALLCPLAFYASCMAAFVVSWCWLRHIAYADSPSLVATAVKGACDAALIYAPFWLIGRRWRLLALLPLWLVPAYMLANVWYSRVFGGMIPFSSLFFFKNFDPILFNSVSALLAPADAMPLILPAVVTAGALASRRQICAQPFGVRLKLLATASSIAAFALLQAYTTMAFKRELEHDAFPRTLANVIKYKYTEYFGDWLDLQHNGLAVFLTKGLAIELSHSHSPLSLTPEQRSLILQTIHDPRHQAAEWGYDFASNQGKNLILIIVESLNSDVINLRVDSIEVAPTLSALVASPGSIAAINMIAQVKDGGSSDGQMLYNTGLLPMRRGAAAMLHPDNRYPSLAKSLPGYTAVEFICEKPHFWNHQATNRQYGYQRLYSEDDLKAAIPDADAIGADAAVLSFALKQMQTLPQPFFAEITTLSMHIPCQEPAALARSRFAHSGLDKLTANYYACVNYFDSALADFIDGLNQAALMDNSVIVIASDHNVGLSQDQLVNGSDPVPGQILFLAINAGATLLSAEYCAQADAYPTILDIMHSPARWRGVGHSILDPGNRTAVDRNGTVWGIADSAAVKQRADAWTVSDLIITSDYFGRYTDINP